MHRIDADPEEINRIRRPELGIGRCRAGARSSPRCRATTSAQRRGMTRSARSNHPTARPKFAPQAAFIAALRAELPENGIFVDEVTQVGHAIRLFWEAYKPRT